MTDSPPFARDFLACSEYERLGKPLRGAERVIFDGLARDGWPRALEEIKRLRARIEELEKR